MAPGCITCVGMLRCFCLLTYSKNNAAKAAHVFIPCNIQIVTGGVNVWVAEGYSLSSIVAVYSERVQLKLESLMSQGVGKHHWHCNILERKLKHSHANA